MYNAWRIYFRRLFSAFQKQFHWDISVYFQKLAVLLHRHEYVVTPKYSKELFDSSTKKSNIWPKLKKRNGRPVLHIILVHSLKIFISLELFKNAVVQTNFYGKIKLFGHFVQIKRLEITQEINSQLLSIT